MYCDQDVKPGNSEAQDLESLKVRTGSIRDGEGGLVSQCSVCGVFMLRVVDVSREMEPSGRQKQA